MADAFITPFSYPELFDSRGYPLPQYRELFDYRVPADRKEQMLRSILEPIQAARFKEYDAPWKEYLKELSEHRVYDWAEMDREEAQRVQDAQRAKAQADIDAYNEAERLRLRAQYSPATVSWFDRMTAELKAIPANVITPDPIAQAAVDREQALKLSALAPAAAGNALQLKAQEETAALMRMELAGRQAAAQRQAAAAAPPAPGFLGGLQRQLEKILQHIHPGRNIQ